MEDQSKDLLEKIEQLSQDIEKSRREISILKKELLHLTGATGTSDKSEPEVKPSTLQIVTGFENFIGLRLIHFAGIIVLLAGLAIGVKYAIDANLITPFMRIALAYGAGIVLFLISFMLRKKYELFSVILFSGAMATIYFTTYGAFEYYSMMLRMVAFILMLLLTAFTVFIALKYNRQEIAILGLAGAYAIPFFVGANNGSVIALFVYIFFINTGILVISLKKYWPPLTYISFSVTWLIYFITYAVKFRPPLSDSFLSSGIIFFILFLLSSLLFKLMKNQSLLPADTIILIADTLFFYCSLLLLFNSSPNTINIITLVFSIVYFAGALFATKIYPLQITFGDTLFSIGLIAGVGYVILKFEGFTVTIIWVLMAISVFVAGMFYRIKLFRMAAMVLFAITILKLLVVDSDRFSDVEKVVAWIFTGTVLLIVSFLYQKFKKTIFEDGGSK